MMSYKFVATCQDCRHRLKGICATLRVLRRFLFQPFSLQLLDNLYQLFAKTDGIALRHKHHAVEGVGYKN